MVFHVAINQINVLGLYVFSKKKKTKQNKNTNPTIHSISRLKIETHHSRYVIMPTDGINYTYTINTSQEISKIDAITAKNWTAGRGQ